MHCTTAVSHRTHGLRYSSNHAVRFHSCRCRLIKIYHFCLTKQIAVKLEFPISQCKITLPPKVEKTAKVTLIIAFFPQKGKTGNLSPSCCINDCLPNACPTPKSCMSDRRHALATVNYSYCSPSSGPGLPPFPPLLHFFCLAYTF